MANYAQLKAAIDQVIKANGQQEITGPVLNQVLKAMVDSLGAGYILAGVATPSTNPGTPDQDVYWLAYQGGTYTNFGGAQLQTGISMLKWNGAWSAQTFFTVDDQLTPNSNNLAKSGAAFDAVMQSGVFDLSAYNSGAKYADLSAALTALNRLPAAYKRGGMSIKFVLSSDNKYVQYRLISPTWSTVVGNWQGVDEEPTAGSKNLVESGGIKLNENLISFEIDGYNQDISNLGQNKYYSLGVKLKAGTYSLRINTVNSGIIALYNGNTYVRDYNCNQNYTLTFEQDTDILRFRTSSSFSNESANFIISNSQSAKSRLTNVEANNVALNTKIDNTNIRINDILRDIAADSSYDIEEAVTDLISGKYYNENGNFRDNANSYYHEPIDISEYAGNNVELKLCFNNIPGSSVRFCLVEDESGNDLVEIKPHQAVLDGERYVLSFGILSTDAKWLKLSWEKGYVTNPTLVYTKKFDAQSDDAVYVDPANGSDENKGTKTNPFQTVGYALTISRNVVLLDGVYNEKGITICDRANIIAEHIGKAVFMPSSSKISEVDGTLIEGSSKVYSLSLSAAIITAINQCVFIYQYGIDDAQTEIEKAYRLPIHQERDFRCDFTGIRHLSTLELVESSDFPAFYVDTTNNILYYSRTSAVSQSNFLFYPTKNALFSNVAGKTFKISGIKTYSLVLNLGNSLNAEVSDCTINAAWGGGCIVFDAVNNLTMIRCEAARAEFKYGNGTGDGFNTHNETAINRSVYTMIDCWAHDNFNDGYSDHELSEGTIIGGVFEYNCVGGHGAGLTPAYGAKDVIRNVVCQKNKDDGIRYTGNASLKYSCIMVMDSLLRDNVANGFNITNDSSGKACATLVNVLSYDNAEYGFINNNQNNAVSCLNCKAVNNTLGDFSGCTNR